VFEQGILWIIDAGWDAGILAGTLTTDLDAIDASQRVDFLIAGGDATHLINAVEDVIERYDDAL
jgi:hypothetical protein